jgi:hypothetical protein
VHHADKWLDRDSSDGGRKHRLLCAVRFTPETEVALAGLVAAVVFGVVHVVDDPKDVALLQKTFALLDSPNEGEGGGVRGRICLALSRFRGQPLHRLGQLLDRQSESRSASVFGLSSDAYQEAVSLVLVFPRTPI